MTSRDRPFGVVILVVLEVLSALGLLVVGAFATLAGGLVAGMGFEEFEALFAGFEALLAGVLVAIGAIFLILGLISLLLAWGLWTGRGWAWTITLILTIIGIIISIPGLITGVGVISLIIYVIIVYYLTRPHVKAFYGKGPAPESPPPPPPS
jgi:uncharacterized membrane protein (DUF2068 family)